MIIRKTTSLVASLLSLPTLLPQILHNPTLPLGIRTATKRAGGFKAGSKDSAGKRRGVKVGGGQWVRPGNIILRQKGTQWHPGENVSPPQTSHSVHIGRDFTILASEPGWVKFYADPEDKTGGRRKYVGVALRRDHELPTKSSLPRRRRLGLREVDPAEFVKVKKLYY